MEESGSDKVSQKPKYGIKRITKLKFHKDREDDLIKSNEMYYCHHGSLIVKVEFTLDSIFLLFCNIDVILGNGKLMAKGKKDWGKIKEIKGRKIKEFEEIKLKMDNDNNENIMIVNIAAGDNHVILLDIQRNIWGYGCNKYKQINPNLQDSFIKTFELISIPNKPV